MQMYDYSRTYLDDAHKQCINNRHLAQGSHTCGCFQCLKNFPPQLIIEWCDNPDEGEEEGVTAICPHCGIDSVLFSAGGLPVEDPEFLRMMHARWFETSSNMSDKDEDEEPN